jgi:hypothetical protein
MRYVEDWDLWLRMSYEGCRMQWLEEPVYLYRIHGSNMVRHATLMKNGMIRMFDKFFALPNLPSSVVKQRNAAYGYAYLNAAARSLSGGDGKEGKACLENAFAKDPDLLTGHPPRAIDMLASFALTPLCPDKQKFMSLLAESLPEPLHRWPQRRVYGALYAVEAFEKAALGQPGVAASAWKAIWNDPVWLMNRGLLALALKSLFGR